MQNIVAPIRLWLIQIWFEVLKLINIPAFAKATWDSKVATYLCGEGSGSWRDDLLDQIDIQASGPCNDDQAEVARHVASIGGEDDIKPGQGDDKNKNKSWVCTRNLMCQIGIVPIRTRG